MLNAVWKQNLFIALTIILLGLLLWWGVSSAIKAAKSKYLLKSAGTITQGFEYFKKDQNRYPASTEFFNIELMRTYLTNFPPLSFATPVCSTNFEYFSGSAQSYELRICLPKSSGGYPKGWSIYKKLP